MIVESIRLTNFRNFKFCRYSFDTGINFIYGVNAIGKTSLAESIYFSSIGRSFRTSDNSLMINKESLDMNVCTKVVNEFGTNEIKIHLNNLGKTIFVNNKNIRKVSSLNKLINVLYFIPKDVNLLKESPKYRRDFLNLTISKMDEAYLNHYNNYEKILKSRNDLLKNESFDNKLLDVYTEQLIIISKEIYQIRKKFISELNVYLSKIFNDITSDKQDVKIVYNSFVDNYDKYEEIAKNSFNKSHIEDMKRKTTTVGVHREDFLVIVNGKDIGKYGSQGENRIITLCLKISPYFVLENKNLKPILILDDVLSELDKVHQSRLLNLLRKFEQVFITSTFKLNENDINYIEIK